MAEEDGALKVRRLINRAQLKQLGITLSNTQLLRLEGKDLFPKRLKITPGKVTWDLDEVRTFIEDRAAERKHRRYGDY